MQALKHRVYSHLHPNRMPNRGKRSKHKRDALDTTVGTISEELEVPQKSEVIFRKIWQLRKFHKIICRREGIDSPIFRCSVNGLTTFWSISIRFWTGPNGKKVRNPLVTCLNLNGCETEEPGQTRIRFQFGVWDAQIKHWEFCPISNIVTTLENTRELLSVGYKTLGILDRHIDNAKDVSIMVKIQLIQAEEEKHSLSQDMARVYFKAGEEYFDTLVFCGQDPEIDLLESGSQKSKNSSSSDVSNKSVTSEEDGMKLIRVNSLVVKARSPMLAVMIIPYKDEKRKNMKYQLDLKELAHSLLLEIFRYMYTDKVENIEANANKLLPLSVKFCIPGLQALCERSLLESITPNNVANILLLADQCKCENLRKGALHYCEQSDLIKDAVVTSKTLAWRVMEMVNPELYLEACESIGSSSSNLDSPPTAGSFSDSD